MADDALAAVKAFVAACDGTSVEPFWHALMDLIIKHPGAFRYAMQAIAITRPKVAPELQHWFSIFWIASKLAECAADDEAMRSALRILLPPYRGPALRLYRGASANERPPYGFSWSTDPDVALWHCKSCAGKTIILETLAPPEAIISAVSKVAGVRSGVGEFEYVVDGSRLNGVNLQWLNR